MTVNRERSLKRLGRSLSQLRQEAGLTQEVLAHKAGLHPTYIGGLERGVRNPTLLTLLALSKGLNCRLSYLIKKAAD